MSDEHAPEFIARPTLVIDEESFHELAGLRGMHTFAVTRSGPPDTSCNVARSPKSSFRRSEALRSPTPVDEPARAAEELDGAFKSPGFVTRM